MTLDPDAVCFGVGGLTYAMTWSTGRLALPEVHKAFQITLPAAPDIVLDFVCDDVQAQGEVVFDSRGVWTLYRQNGSYVICFQSPVIGPQPYMVGVFDDALSTGKLYIRPDRCLREELVQPMYPLDELLLVNALGQQRGVLLHASLVDDDGRGWLFTGQSGAGKSTMASLWERVGTTGIYSDDRVVVRQENGQFWAYGTPWHGTGVYAAPYKVPLSGIFVLHHAPQDSCMRLSPLSAVAQLFARCFPTFWNRDGLNFTMAFLERLVTSVPCFELGFQPTEEIVAFVRALDSCG